MAGPALCPCFGSTALCQNARDTEQWQSWENGRRENIKNHPSFPTGSLGQPQMEEVKPSPVTPSSLCSLGAPGTSPLLRQRRALLPPSVSKHTRRPTHGKRLGFHFPPRGYISLASWMSGIPEASRWKHTRLANWGCFGAAVNTSATPFRGLLLPSP